MQQKHTSGSMRGVRLFSVGALLAMTLTSGCAETMASGDAGCVSYAEQRLVMPRDTLLSGSWGDWVADTDDRMTGACR